MDIHWPAYSRSICVRSSWFILQLRSPSSKRYSQNSAESREVQSHGRLIRAFHKKSWKSVRTGKRKTMAERAYCQGFVRPHEADEILRWMWAHTDKHAVKTQVGDDAVDDKVFADVGTFGVTTNDGGATWITKVRPSGPAILRTWNYPSSSIWESATREDRARGAQGDRPRAPRSGERGLLAVRRHDHRPDRERAVGPVFPSSSGACAH